MDYAIKKADGRYYCLLCEEKGTLISYTLMENVHRHRRRFHGITCDAPIKQKVSFKPKLQNEIRKNVTLVAKTETDDCCRVERSCGAPINNAIMLQHEALQHDLNCKNEKLHQDNEVLQNIIQALSQKIEWVESQNDRIIKNVSTKRKTTIKPTVPKQLKTKIWQNAYGMESVTGKCCCCGITDLHITHFEAGHLISHANGGEMSENNLRPVCSECNKGMGTKNMRDYAMIVHPLTSPLLREKKSMVAITAKN